MEALISFFFFKFITTLSESLIYLNEFNHKGFGREGHPLHMPSAFAAFPTAAAVPGAMAAAAAAAADQRGSDGRYLWDPSGRIHPTFQHPG